MGNADDLRNWERKALAALMGLVAMVMGVWAGVVYDTGQDVLREVASIRAELQSDRLVNERRLTILEQRQSYVIETLRRMHADADVPLGEVVPKGRGPTNGRNGDDGE